MKRKTSIKYYLIFCTNHHHLFRESYLLALCKVYDAFIILITFGFYEGGLSVWQTDRIIERRLDTRNRV